MINGSFLFPYFGGRHPAALVKELYYLSISFCEVKHKIHARSVVKIIIKYMKKKCGICKK